MTGAPEKVDVVIIGSGAAGSLLAAKLSKAGKSVTLLEAGPKRTLNSLTSSQIHARRLKWHGAPVEETGTQPISNVFNSGFGTGGSALHHFGVWPRLHAEDFKVRSLHGRALDWPIGHDDLRPYYDRIQQEVGISGDQKTETWRPEGADYPLPPAPVFLQGEVIARGFHKLGKSTAPLPLALNSRDYKGRPACLWDGWCDAGCPTGALANPLVLYLPQARKAQGRIIHNAAVTRILTDRKGKKVTGVIYHTEDGTRVSQMARMVIVAAFAVQTPRLLLASADGGLANRSGMVGRYLMSHAAATVFGLFDEETEPYMGATGGQLLNQDSYDHKDRRDSGFGSYQWMIAQAVKPNDLLGIGGSNPAVFGAELTDFMKKAVHHFGGMTACIEDLPLPENRVSLSSRKDSFGVPLAVANHCSHKDSTALWQSAKMEGAEIFRAAQATSVWHGPQGAMHIMGGTIMGKDGETSVTNSYGQCHDIDNLFIAGPGLFPTSGGVNPTFTVHALTLRSSEYILKNWSSLT
ncbi:Glucose-methanol-choline (GMC) oxidoreductase:NAD binding site [hydrothermal vent metagenome]|uniref:Glucose-methanol-choline (GMC) oxidoreductase:NAD binding site n=1 Tax=hydrothermal vent metagenome TaxID=652676 RepID=A0A3B0S056_9ZZZZ